MAGSVQCGSETGPVTGSGAGSTGGRSMRVGSALFLLAVERDAQGGPGAGRGCRRAVAVAQLVVGPAGRDVVALHGLGRLVGADDAYAFSRVFRLGLV